MDSQDFPRKIYLMDDEFNDTKWSEEKNPYGDVGEDSLEYISAETMKELLEEQRQICADVIPESSLYKDHCYLPTARKACINATGEKNEN